MMKMLRNAKNSIGVKLQITSLNLRWASDIRKREPPSTRPNMPMGDEEMEFGSDDPLGSCYLKPITSQPQAAEKPQVIDSHQSNHTEDRPSSLGTCVSAILSQDYKKLVCI